jgi:hypothetical protein
LEIVLPNIKRYDPIGECVYCHAAPGHDDLTLEHIVPDGLAGRLSLQKASCGDCQKITHKIEEFCLRRQFLEARTHLKMGRRRPKERLSALRVFRHSADEPFPNLSEVDWRWENLPVSLHPWALQMPVFIPPGGEKRATYRLTPQMMDVYLSPDYMPRLAATAGKKTLNMQPFSPDIFARMLAKIGHCAAVAALGLGGFKPWLAPYIRGVDMNFAHLIGCSGAASSFSPHWSELIVSTDHGRVTVFIRLFARLTLTRYEIWVGEPL